MRFIYTLGDLQPIPFFRLNITQIDPFTSHWVEIPTSNLRSERK